MQRDLQSQDASNKERLLAIVEATTDLINITDARGERIFYLNQAGRRMLDIGADEDVGCLKIVQFCPSWALERIRKESIPAAQQHGVWSGESGFVSRSGQEIIVSQLIVAHRRSDGTVDYLSTIARDITESKRAQEALRRSEQLFRIMAENATELIALVDATGRRLYNSPSYEKVLGYRPDDLQGTFSMEQIHPDDRAKVIAAANETKATGLGKFIEYRMRHGDGSWRTLESHAGVIRNARGEIENLLIVARDITARKRAEQERAQMEIQLRHAQKMESIGQLAAGIAHEINTPIQYVGDNTRFLKDAFADLNSLLQQYQNFVAAAKTNALSPDVFTQLDLAIKRTDLDYLVSEIPKAIDQSLDGVDRVANIVLAMKEFSHPGTEEKVAIDLNKAIESTLTVTRNEWKYVADIVTDFDPSLPMVFCRPGELNQAILNLIVNATHAITDALAGRTKQKGTIRITTKRDADAVEIRVSDTGTGIPEHVRGKIFEPFFTTKPVGKGTGQGLAIVHSVIVGKHQGSIAFETEMGKGTTFIIRLPITPPRPEDKK